MEIVGVFPPKFGNSRSSAVLLSSNILSHRVFPRASIQNFYEIPLIAVFAKLSIISIKRISVTLFNWDKLVCLVNKSISWISLKFGIFSTGNRKFSSGIQY